MTTPTNANNDPDQVVTSRPEPPDDRPQKYFRHLPAGASIVSARRPVPIATARTRASISRDMTRAAAAELLGPVVYAIRLDADTIRIGWTTDLARRMHELGKTTQLLAFQGCPIERDAEPIHTALAGHRIHGMTYTTHAVVLDLVNDWRRDLGMEPIHPEG